MVEGTLIAAFITRDSVYLLSDGRVINTDTGQVHNTHSKVHKLSERCGLLVAGAYMPKLPGTVSKIAEERGMPAVEQVAPIVRQEMEATWKLLENRESPESIYRARAFAFVVGFDSCNEPRLFYIDNKSEPAFRLQERHLFGDGNNIEIGSLSTGSGEIEDPSGMLSEEIRARLPIRDSLQQLFIASFNGVKNVLSSQYERIGGETFLLTLNKE